MCKIVSVQEVLDEDVIIATDVYYFQQDFACDPFEDDKGCKTISPDSRRGGNFFPDGPCVRITILGPPSVGKSALALRYCRSDFINCYETTIEEE